MYIYYVQFYTILAGLAGFAREVFNYLYKNNEDEKTTIFLYCTFFIY